ncbi:MAG: alpha/beta hydrolase [Rhodobacteraceae bacterium]|nr:alpha/beta hydrolase [Paracoccaceae bacterium]
MTNPLIAARDRFTALNPERRININSRDWGVIRVGDTGPALVLIPGTLGRADVFWQQIAALRGTVRILAVSYPSCGGIKEWAADIAAMIKGEGMQGAVVLGSSLGGYLAQYITGHYPGLVGGLVVANTLATTRGIDQMPPYKFDLETIPIKDLRAGFETGLKTWLDPSNPYADLAGLLLAEVAGRIPEAELRARLQALKHAPDLPGQTLERAAIFTVQSDDDHLITPSWRKAVRDALNPARAFRFREASHFAYVARPDDYSAMLNEILGLTQPGSHWPIGQEAVL